MLLGPGRREAREYSDDAGAIAFRLGAGERLTSASPTRRASGRGVLDDCYRLESGFRAHRDYRYSSLVWSSTTWAYCEIACAPPPPAGRAACTAVAQQPIDADPRLGRLAVCSVAGEDLPHALDQLGGDPGDGGLSPWWIDQLLGWRLLAKVRNRRPLLRVKAERPTAIDLHRLQAFCGGTLGSRGDCVTPPLGAVAEHLRKRRMACSSRVSGARNCGVGRHWARRLEYPTHGRSAEAFATG
jgi:hypothetical protein